ncbi:MAG: hypothetical protein OXC81_03790 [Betaproteobacteria bacterium]|nr:hypothetical protein [Betaproteobacteria bacterium]
MNDKDTEQQQQAPQAGPKLRQYMPHAGAAVQGDPKRKLQGEKFDPSKAAGAKKPLPTVRQYMPSAGAAVKAEPKRKLQGARLDPAKIGEAKPLPTVRQYMPLKVGELRKSKAAEAEKARANAPDAIRPVEEEETPKPRPVRKAPAPPPAAAKPPPVAPAPPPAEPVAAPPPVEPVAPPPVVEEPAAAPPPPPPAAPVAEEPREIRMSINIEKPQEKKQPTYEMDLGPEELFDLEPSLEVALSEGGLLSGIFGPKASASKYKSFYSKPLARLGESDFLYQPLVALERIDIARQLIPDLQKQIATLSCKKFKKALLDNSCPLHLATSAVEQGSAACAPQYCDQLLKLLVPDLDEETEREGFLTSMAESGRLMERLSGCAFLGAPAALFAVQEEQNSYIELTNFEEFDNDIDIEFRKWLLIYLDVAMEMCDIAANVGEGIPVIGRLPDIRNAIASLEALGKVEEGEAPAEE